MTGKGTVVSVNGEFAEVKIIKFGACSHDCAECSACTAPSYKAKVRNEVRASVGDTVVIENSSSAILFTALVMYIVPVILIICAAAAAAAKNKTLIAALVTAALIWALALVCMNKKMPVSGTAVKIIGKEAVK